MKRNHFLFATAIMFLVIVSACRKNNVSDQLSNSTSSSQSANIITNSCGFAYSDSIFYPSEFSTGSELHPVNQLSGSFGSYPDGLEIDERSGNIEITQSETGLKYLVWYVATGSKDTCKLFLTVSGVNYPDSIYSLKNATPFSTPLYNGTSQQPVICTGNCEFDDGHDDDNGNGFADEPPAGQEIIPKGVAMDKSSGSINLKQSIANGALGTNPLPGTFKDFILNYRLSDRSAKALNKMTLRIYYYKTQSQIPAKLKANLEEKKKFTLLNDITDPYKVSYTVKKKGGGDDKNGAGEVKCRPPYIIVVQK